MGFLLVAALGCAAVGCAGAPGFDPDAKGPQLVVEPNTVSLGVAALMETRIRFLGRGFDPHDSVFIELSGVRKGDREASVPIADAEADAEGRFEARVPPLVKISELLNAGLEANEMMEDIIVLTEPPIAAGTYRARAVSLYSGKTAACEMTLTEPSVLDRSQDQVWVVKGKIRRR